MARYFTGSRECQQLETLHHIWDEHRIQCYEIVLVAQEQSNRPKARFFASSALARANDAALAQGRSGSSAAGRGTQITTAHNSEAASHGTKRDTG